MATAEALADRQLNLLSLLLDSSKAADVNDAQADLLRTAIRASYEEGVQVSHQSSISLLERFVLFDFHGIYRVHLIGEFFRSQFLLARGVEVSGESLTLAVEQHLSKAVIVALAQRAPDVLLATSTSGVCGALNAAIQTQQVRTWTSLFAFWRVY